MRSHPHAVVVVAGLLATAILTGAGVALSPSLSTVGAAVERPMPTENRPLSVTSASSREPRPLVLAWEDGRAALPSFALYETGLFLRSIYDRTGSYVSGALTPAQASVLSARFVAARLESMAPHVRLFASADTNVTTVCVAERGGWVCASVDGLDPPSASDAGPYRVQWEARAPLPEPFALARALLTEARDWPGRPWTASSFDVQVSALDPAEQPSWAGPPVDWPPELPALAVDRDHLQQVSPGEAAAIRAFVERAEDGVRIRGRAASVELVVPHLPALDTMLAVRHAFERFLYGLP